MSDTIRVAGKTAEEWKTEAGRHLSSREESFQRCDTDGFLSQWADGLHANMAEMNAQIAKDGGKAEFVGLFDANTGKRVPAVLIDAKYGQCWSLCDPETGEFLGQFVSYRGLNAGTRAKNNLRKLGYEERLEWAPAVAYITGTGYGLSGHAWATIRRTDGGYPGRR